jgi:hypothetical protein
MDGNENSVGKMSIRNSKKPLSLWGLNAGLSLPRETHGRASTRPKVVWHTETLPRLTGEGPLTELTERERALARLVKQKQDNSTLQALWRFMFPEWLSPSF